MSKQLHNELKIGTPSTLYQAIRNGLNAFQVGQDAAAIVQPHLRDFLAQKFAVPLLEANDQEALMLKKLWEKITGETLCLTTGVRSTSIDNISEDLRNESRG
jgi:hypothetical protein